MKDFFNTKLHEMILKNDLSALCVGPMRESFIMHIKKEKWKLGLKSNQCQSQPKHWTEWGHFIGPALINKVDIVVDLRDLKWNSLKIKNIA